MINPNNNLNPPDFSGISQESIMQSFQNSQQKNQSVEVLKELFDKDKLHLITDLTSDEIKLMVRIYMVAKIKKIKLWEDALNMFMMLLLSRNRQSRKELLKAIGNIPQESQNGFSFNPFKRR